MAEAPENGLPGRLFELTSRLEQLEARVALLEVGRSGALTARSSSTEDEALVAPDLPQGTLALVGRTLLVLAGAYVVRALTESHLFPASVGVALGIAYAAFWQLRADREALAGRTQSAAFHDVASSLIAFPLVWEAATRFSLLPAAAAAAVLVAFFALGLAVAWHRTLAANAAVTTFLALATAVALLVSTHDLVACLLALAAILAALEGFALRGAWPALRWPAAVLLDAVGFLLVAVATRPQLPEGYAPFSPTLAAVVLGTIPALAFSSIAIRTLRLGQPVRLFEIVQGALATALGLFGAVRVLEAHGLPDTVPGALALALGVLCYGAAFAFAERRCGPNFYFFSTAGGLLTMAGTWLVGMGPALPVGWAAVGLCASVLGRRFDRMTLRTHGALFLAAASVQTGLLAACARSLGSQSEVSLTLAAWVAAAATAVGWLVLATDPAAPRSGAPRLPQLLLALITMVALAKVAHVGLCLSTGGWLAADAGASAAARTAVLSALALGLAAAARRVSLPELGWLVYPVLFVVGLKLLAEDLKDGRPATLVMSLALYGLALTLAPRLLGRAVRS